MLSFEEARARALADVSRVAGERVDVRDCVGRVLREDVRAHKPLPAFDYSAMDGYAVRASDLASRADLTLRVVGESRTGGTLPSPVEPGTACRIFTGARIPPDADAVVMQEEVTREGDRARFRKAPRSGDHIRRAGEDVAEGSVVLERGTRVTPYQIGLLASVEALRVTVARRPVVSILSTGDELRDAGAPDRPGAVVDSNGPSLAALVEACGGVARALPFASDELDDTTRAVAEALERSDLVLTVGGVSVGEHDVVRAALERAGVTLDFWKVAIKPGKPLCLGRRENARVLGLPGNPASAMLTFLLFGAPLLRVMQGDRSPLPPTLDATLEAGVKRSPGRTEFLRVVLDERRRSARVLTNQASGAVTSFAWANALAVVAAEVDALPAGATVACVRLSDV
jgi:molybdopterin molybdotransferase